MELINPRDVMLTRFQKDTPEPNKSPDWTTFLQSVARAGGVREAIDLTPGNQLIHGKRRLRAAQALGLDAIPFVRREESEAVLIFVDSRLHCRHMTLGAAIYSILPVLEEFIRQANSRRLANLAKGKNSEKTLIFPKPTQYASGKTLEDLADSLGCCPATLDQAIRVQKFFRLEHRFEFQDGMNKTLKEHFEPLLLAGDIGLGDCLKGIGWFVDGKGQPKEHPSPERNTHLFYIEKGFDTFSKASARWDKLTDKERASARDYAAEQAEMWSDSFLEAIAETISAARKQRRKQPAA